MQKTHSAPIRMEDSHDISALITMPFADMS